MVTEIERAQGGAKEQKERFKTLLVEVVKSREGQLFVYIPPDNPREYPLRRKNGDDQVRAWALGEYINRYGENGKVANYEAARGELWLERGEPTQENNEEQATRGRGRPKSQQSLAEKLAMEAVKKCHDFIIPARSPGAYFCRVPYLKDNPDFSYLYTGMWYITEKNAKRMLDAAIYPQQGIRRPHADSKSMVVSGRLLFINCEGQEKTLPFDSVTLKDGIDKKLAGFVVWPELPTDRYRLLEAINALLRKVDIQDCTDSLGWIFQDEKITGWLGNNGMETETDFIPGEKCPVVAPDMISAGNGYRLDGLERPLNEDIWYLHLEKISPYPAGIARRVAFLGAFARVLFPDGTVEKAGTLDFALENVGDGSGIGKSAELNRLLSLYGLDFGYRRTTLLTATDTMPARTRAMSRMRYLLYTDYDRKSHPGSNRFAKEHASRREMGVLFGDETGGGVRTADHGRKEESRGEITGGAILTGNYDHARVSITEQEYEEEAYEFRFCSFVWQAEEKADRETSVALDARRDELYAWGRAFRRWIMHEYNRDRAAFRLQVQEWKAQAERDCNELDYPWNTRQQNAAIDLVWGLHAWLAFLEATIPNYTQHYLYSIIQQHVTDQSIFLSLIDRDSYLQSLIAKRDSGEELGKFIIDAIRAQLDGLQGYVKSQQDELLKETDVTPYSLSPFGYRHFYSNEDVESWQSGHTPVGYYLSRKQQIAFDLVTLYPLLAGYAAKNKYRLPPRDELKEKLQASGILEKPYQTRIAGEKTRFTNMLLISVSTLGIEPRGIVDEEEEEQLREAGKIIDLARMEEKQVSPPAQLAQAVNAPPVGEIIPSRSHDPFDIDLDYDLKDFDPMA